MKLGIVKGSFAASLIVTWLGIVLAQPALCQEAQASTGAIPPPTAMIKAETKAAGAEDETATEQTEKKEPFDFEYFEELMGPLPAHEEERVCGLDKVCVQLWKKGKLQVDKDGHLLEGDFNMDGRDETAVILEQDDPEDPSGKQFLMYISQKTKDGRQVLLHAVLPGAKNVLQVFWDKNRNALIVDTGGRVVQSESVSNFNGITYNYGTGRIQKVVVVVAWNPTTNVFDVITPKVGERLIKKRKK